MTTTNCINNNLNNSIFYKELDLTAAEFKGMFATPVLFLPAPGANYFYNVFEFGISLFYNSIAYTGGGSISLKTQSATAFSGNLLSSNFTGTASKSSIITTFANGNLLISDRENKDVYITNVTAAFANGDSPVRVFALYAKENILNPDPVTYNELNNRNENQYIKTVKIISSADVLALGTTPYEIVPSPGVGKAIGMYAVDIINLYNSVAYNSVTLAVNYAGDTSNLVTWTSPLMTATASTKSCQNPVSNHNYTICENKGITLRSTTGVTTGNSPLKVISYYTIIDL